MRLPWDFNQYTKAKNNKNLIINSKLMYFLPATNVFYGFEKAILWIQVSEQIDLTLKIKTKCLK